MDVLFWGLKGFSCSLDKYHKVEIFDQIFSSCKFFSEAEAEAIVKFSIKHIRTIFRGHIINMIIRIWYILAKILKDESIYWPSPYFKGL